MQLKSPTSQAIHVALLSGHAITIGPEGRDVPLMFRREALAAGAIPAALTAADIDQDPQAPTEQDKPALLVAGIKQLLETDPEALTAGGTPNRKKLAAIVGWNVTAEELAPAWQAVEAEAAKGE